MGMDAIYDFLSHIIRTGYEDIPGPVKDLTKRCFLDTLGAIIAGSTAPGCKEVVEIVKAWGGTKESTIAVFGERVPAPNAIWANSTMGRAQEVDCFSATGDHADVSAVPAALAMSEVMGRITGKDAITAIILAIDFNIRLRLATGRFVGETPWTAGTYAPFPSVIVAGKLMRMSESQFLNAAGFAFAQLSNTIQGNSEGALSVRVHNGMGARNGFIAALLAKKGITGPHDILEGKYGYYRIFEQNRYNREVLLDRLGKKFYSEELMMKPYSCCAMNFLPIEGTLELVREHKLQPGDISEIVVRTNQGTYNFIALPVETKRAPDNPTSAQFSLYFTLACAVMKGDVYLAHFTPESLRDPGILEMAGRVTAVVDPSHDPKPGTLPSCRVEIRTKGGKVLSAKPEYFKGHPRNPMTFDECVTKFKKNLTFAAKPLPHKNVDRIIDMVKKLEDVEDVAEISRLMAS